MSSNSNFKKDKCWSCEFFCGKRNYKKGFLLGDSAETVSQGTCSNKRSSNFGKTVRENEWCSKYQKWGVLQSALARQELQRQQQIQEQQQAMVLRETTKRRRQEQQEYEHRERHLAEERRQIEEERKQLELQRWYSSLSPEERERYDQKQARLKAESEERQRIEAKKRREEQYQQEENERLLSIEREEQRQREELTKKRKKKIILISLLAVLLTIAIIVGTLAIFAAVKNSAKHKAFVESGGEQIVSYIQSQSNGDDSCEFAFNYNGVSYKMEIEYREDYYDESGFPTLFGKGAYSFYASVKSFKGGKPYTYCTGKAVFNWQGLQNLNEISLIGSVQYQSNLVYNYYKDYTKGAACPEMTYGDVTHGNGRNLSFTQIEESIGYSWEMCKITMIGLNQLSNQVLGHDLW